MLLPTMWAFWALMSASASSRGGVAVGAAQGVVDADYYAILKINSNADSAEIRAAYRQAALSAHPDKGGTPQEFHLISEAFNVLSCTDNRSCYDQRRVENTRLAHHCKGQKRKGSEDPTAERAKNAKSTPLARKNQALQHLRFLLQSMDKPSRDAAMSNHSIIPEKVQLALIEFIRKSPETTPKPSDRFPQRISVGSTRLCTKNNVTTGKNSNAELDIENLRFYTRMTNVEAAVEQQLILAKVLDRVSAASGAKKEFWDIPVHVRKIFDEVFAEHGTSMQEFGLSVRVEMRAPEWVANANHITSPVLPFEEAVALRARLLHARCTSWDRLRAEWVPLLQRGKCAWSLEDAEKHVQHERRIFLNKQLGHAVANAARALDVQDRLVRKESTLASRTSTMQAKTSVATNCEKEYLSAKRLRVHERAFKAATPSGIEATRAFLLKSTFGIQSVYS